MSKPPRTERWMELEEDARAMADRMHDPESKRVLLEIADSYDRLAEWTATTAAVEASS